jgi:hypothetical protein
MDLLFGFIVSYIIRDQRPSCYNSITFVFCLVEEKLEDFQSDLNGDILKTPINLFVLLI